MSKSYSYFDGKENRWIPDSDHLYSELMDEVRKVFKIHPYSNGGLSELELKKLLMSFLDHRKGAKS